MEMQVTFQEVLPGLLLLLSAAAIVLGEKLWAGRKPAEPEFKTEQKTELLEELDDQEWEWPEQLMSARQFRAEIARKAQESKSQRLWLNDDPRGEADR
jgi:hypothetical protein